MQNIDRKENSGKQFTKRILDEQKKINRKKKIYFKFLKYAAVLILFFSLKAIITAHFKSNRSTTD